MVYITEDDEEGGEERLEVDICKMLEDMREKEVSGTHHIISAV